MTWKSEVSKNDLDFDITKKMLYVKTGKGKNVDYVPCLRESDGKDMPRNFGRFALWNERDNEFLGVASKKYNVVGHGVILDHFHEALDDLKLNISDMKITATPNKNRVWADVLFNPREVVIEDNKDDWDVGCTVMHGADGYAGLSISPFISRLVCTNGMRSVKILGKERNTHKVADLESWFVKHIRQVLYDIDTRFDVIPKMFQIDVEIEPLLKTVEKRFGKKFMTAVDEEFKSPSNDNPLYRVGKDSVSLYDVLNNLTYINHARADTVNGRNLANRYYGIEKIVNSYLPTE